MSRVSGKNLLVLSLINKHKLRFSNLAFQAGGDVMHVMLSAKPVRRKTRLVMVVGVYELCSLRLLRASLFPHVAMFQPNSKME